MKSCFPTENRLIFLRRFAVQEHSLPHPRGYNRAFVSLSLLFLFLIWWRIYCVHANSGALSHGDRLAASQSCCVHCGSLWSTAWCHYTALPTFFSLWAGIPLESPCSRAEKGSVSRPPVTESWEPEFEPQAPALKPSVVPNVCNPATGKMESGGPLNLAGQLV